MTMRCIAPLFGLFLAGCATATIEDAVPAGALAGADTPAPVAAPAEADVAAPAVEADAAAAVEADTAAAPERAPTAGTYPNLNEPRATAAPQITAGQRAAETADLRAKREALARAPREAGTGDSAAELRRLAATHGDKVLKEIEGE